MPSKETPLASSPWTRCWLIDDADHGEARIQADSVEEALEEFIRHRGLAAYRSGDVADVAAFRQRPQLRVRELVFQPAASERHKPHGWPRHGPKVQLRPR